MRGFSFVLNEKNVADQHFRCQKCAPSHTFFRIEGPFPAPPVQNVENRSRKPMHFVIHSEFSARCHQLPICAKHRKSQRENRLDHRKTGIRHRFALEISMSQAIGAKEKPAFLRAAIKRKERTLLASLCLFPHSVDQLCKFIFAFILYEFLSTASIL